jgi:hypothetical protein
VAGFSGGYSEPNVNIITVATSGGGSVHRHQAAADPESRDGSQDRHGDQRHRKSLDQAPHYYVAKSHQGPHCENNANYTATRTNKWEGRPCA